MKAAVFHKFKDIRYEHVPDPRIETSTDAIVRVTSTSICGSDLHIYNGYFPQFRKMTLGHEFMGIVEEVGADVRNLKKGDRVIVPFPIACGRCYFCDHRLPTACENSNVQHYGPRGGLITEKGGGIFGYTDLYGGYDGGQAEAVRVPFADYGPRKVPENLSDEKALFLTDIFPTGWSSLAWTGMTGGETVAVFGSGPVGLMAQKAAWYRKAGRVIAVDRLPHRLHAAQELCGSEIVDASGNEDPADAIIEMTNGRGADICVEAVGMESEGGIKQFINSITHLQAGSIDVLRSVLTAVKRGGTVSILGVYATTYDNFPLGQWFDKGLKIWGGQAPVHNYIDQLLTIVAEGKIRLDDIISHTMPLSEISKAYDIFNKREDNCVKIVLKP